MRESLRGGNPDRGTGHGGDGCGRGYGRAHRPYRPELGIEKALAEIERGRDTVTGLLNLDAG